MRLLSFLPVNRFEAGVFCIVEADTVLFGPVRARGEADSISAAGHANAREDPTMPYGDHPAGVYRIDHVVDIEPARRAIYGPHFLALDPLEGEALLAKQRGRTGLGIHGGRLHADRRPREAFGCLRLDEDAIRAVAALVRPRLLDQRLVLYECRVIS